jgi:aspartate carbamoyltransferase regulatory subunit
MLVILEYLHSTSNNKSLSKYHIITKIPELKQQRQDRISLIMRTLEKNGLIISTETPNATFYRITEYKCVDKFLQKPVLMVDLINEVRMLTNTKSKQGAQILTTEF